MPPTPEQNDPRKQQSDEFDRLLDSLTSGQASEKLSPDIQSTMRIAIPKESDWLAKAARLEGATQSVPVLRQEERIPLPPPEPEVSSAGTAEHPTAAHVIVPPPAPVMQPQPQYVAPPPPPKVTPPVPPRPVNRPAPVHNPQPALAQAPPVEQRRVSTGQQTLFAALLVFAIFLLIALSAVLYFDLRLPSAG
jgi:hypothetical protein